MSGAGLHELGALALRRALAAGECTALDAAEGFLERIAALDAGARGLGAFAAVTAEAARQRAAALDAARAAGPAAAAARDPRRAPLWGVPFADKDLVDRAGAPAARGSLALAGRVPDESSPLARRMDAAGGVSLGKTSTPEFGLVACAGGPFGVVRNPWRRDRDPGGSSSGAAVAVAARLLPCAPGSDGGGSVRIPAAACGVLGIKPSRGHPCGVGQTDGAGGLSVPGALARTAADSALLLAGMSGRPAPGPLAPPGRLRLAWSCWSPWRQTVPELRTGEEELRVLAEAVGLLERLGHRMEPAPDPAVPGFAAAFRTVWETGAALAAATAPRPELLEPFTRRLAEAGSRHAPEARVAAFATLERCRRELVERFRDYDAVLTPVLAGPPWPAGAHGELLAQEGFERQCRLTPFTAWANVAGLPAVSMPIGERTDGSGLPIGVQAVGRLGSEGLLLRLAAQLERELRWDLRVPPEAEGRAVR